MQAKERLSPGGVASVAVVLFAVFSFAGWLYETVENALTFSGLYLRASLMLPWCPIYGIGGLLIVALIEPLRQHLVGRTTKTVEVALVSIAIYALTALVELVGSYACEAIMGYVPWDYSQAWLNFDGRIAPQYTLCFVALGLMALYAVFPHVRRWAAGTQRAAARYACALAALFALDNELQALGVWAPVKDALVPLGIRHW